MSDDFDLDGPTHVARRRDADATGPTNAAGGDGGLPPHVQAMLQLQRSVGNRGVAQLMNDGEDDAQRSPIDGVVGSGGGQPLDEATRSTMERGIGADLSSVRVHTGEHADASARALQASAYTVGDEVVFRSGSYNPGTPDGNKLLAHELTHVVQQRSGPVDGTPAAGGIMVSDPSDRFERAAEANAERVSAGLSGGAPDTGASGVQRDVMPEEEPEDQVAQTSVQREAAPDDDKEEEPEVAQGSFVQREELPEEDEQPPAG